MQLSPPPTVSRPWGHPWIEWIGSLYRYLVYRKKYLIATGSVSLTTGVTSTTVTDTSCLSTSKVFLTATDSTAATSATNIYISAVATGSFTVTHSNSGSARTLSYLIVNE